MRTSHLCVLFLMVAVSIATAVPSNNDARLMLEARHELEQSLHQHWSSSSFGPATSTKASQLQPQQHHQMHRFRKTTPTAGMTTCDKKACCKKLKRTWWALVLILRNQPILMDLRLNSNDNKNMNTAFTDISKALWSCTSYDAGRNIVATKINIMKGIVNKYVDKQASKTQINGIYADYFARPTYVGMKTVNGVILGVLSVTGFTETALGKGLVLANEAAFSYGDNLMACMERSGKTEYECQVESGVVGAVNAAFKLVTDFISKLSMKKVGKSDYELAMTQYGKGKVMKLGADESKAYGLSGLLTAFKTGNVKKNLKQAAVEGMLESIKGVTVDLIAKRKSTGEIVKDAVAAFAIKSLCTFVQMSLNDDSIKTWASGTLVPKLQKSKFFKIHSSHAKNVGKNLITMPTGTNLKSFLREQRKFLIQNNFAALSIPFDIIMKAGVEPAVGDLVTKAKDAKWVDVRRKARNTPNPQASKYMGQ